MRPSAGSGSRAGGGMPISTEDRARYPANWSSELSPAVLLRARLQCECMGECGRGHEGVRCPERHLHWSVWGGLRHRVILTTAHVNHTPEDGRPEILRAWCQGCHLHYDRDHHDQSRVLRLQLGLEAAGQETLFDARAVGRNGACQPADGFDVEEISQWALPLVDPRRFEELQTLSVELLPEEVRAGLDAAI